MINGFYNLFSKSEKRIIFLDIRNWLFLYTINQKLTIIPTIQNKHQLAKLLTTIFLLFLFIILFSCKKSELKEDLSENVSSAANFTLTSECDVTICEDCSFQEMIENDTTEYATVLGGTYPNPYSIANITQAYNNIHGTNLQSVGTTHYYVRFKPENEAQLNILDSSLDLELYDYPLDRVVIQDGDYWPEAYANLEQNEYPWLYTVVESNFQFPSGIQYENLLLLNIPNDDAALEDEAFNLTGNNECGGGIATAASETTITGEVSSGSKKSPSPNFYEECDEGFYWDPVLRRCVPDNPPPPPTFLYPKGMISFKSYDDYGIIPPSAPLRNVRIVGRRFFKIDKTYTDANGNFQFSKRFPRKVTLIVKFRTSSVTIKQEPVSDFPGFWKYWLPIRKNIGTYKVNNLQNLNYEFQKGSTYKKRITRNWIASATLNTATETQSFLLDNNLNYLQNEKIIFLFQALIDQNISPQYDFIINSHFQSNKKQIYMWWGTSDINSITTSRVTINAAIQLGIKYLEMVNNASNDGINLFNDYSLSLHASVSNNPWPFGNGVSVPSVQYNADIVAMWQSFAQNLGHTIANRAFGYGEYNFSLQGKTWVSSGGISSSSKYLEGFDPSIGPPNDNFNWIPVGLINDLMDSQTDPFPVIDNVSGFTYSEIQSVYYLEPQSIAEFKNAFKTIRPSQATAIDQLFTSYGY